LASVKKDDMFNEKFITPQKGKSST